MHSKKALLKNISVISDNYKKIERATGCNFNIFSIANIERLEVNTHSAMLAELLSPSGTHGQGSIFLKRFTEVLGVEGLCSLEEIKVFKEKSFNNGSERVDILIKFNDFTILIENKIDAKDQNKQLKRYDDVAKNIGTSDYRLVYLTKDGGEASKNSHQGVSYLRISYREDIVKWLELCIKEVALVPIVREAIQQYHSLIKKITGVGMSNEYRKEIVSLLLEGNNITYAKELASALPEANGVTLYRFFNKLKKEVLSVSPSIEEVKIVDSERLYDEEKCINWFNKRKNKTECVGLFFHIGVSGILFHVEVATVAFHYGVVAVEEKNNQYTVIGKEIKLNNKYKKRGWELLKWYSHIYQHHIPNNMDVLMKPDPLISEIISSINELQKT